jgi:hypothetical protein
MKDFVLFICQFLVVFFGILGVALAIGWHFYGPVFP